MKKLLALLLTLVLSFAFVSCTEIESSPESGESITEKTTYDYTIGVVDGAPSLAVGNIAKGYVYDGDTYKVNTSVAVSNQPTEIVAGLTNGDLDMAIIPLNLGSKLYNESKNLNLKLASVNVFGCLYMIGKTDITSVEDLKGKVVYTVGQSGTPEIIFSYLLAQKGITYEYGDEAIDNEKVFVKVAEATEIIQKFKTGAIEYAILGEPVVSKINKATGTHVVMDMQAEWLKYNEGGKFVQAGLVVKGDVAEKREYITALLAKLSENENYLKENVDTLKDLYTEIGSVALQMDFTTEIIESCNIGCSKASNEKTNIEAFLNAVKNFKAPLIGGQLPGEDFYL